MTQVLVLIGINLAIGFLVGGIDWRAHLGGLVTGGLSRRCSRTRRAGTGPWSSSVGVAVIVLVLVVATYVRDQQLQTQVAALLGG